MVSVNDKDFIIKFPEVADLIIKESEKIKEAREKHKKYCKEYRLKKKLMV